MTKEATPEVASLVEKAATGKKRGRPKGSRTDPAKLERKQQNQLDRKLQEARDQMILAARLAGESTSQIAETFNVGQTSVNRALTRAQQTELFKQVRDAITTRLVPKAVVVLEAALDQGNVEVAMFVAKGTGLINEKRPGSAGDGEDGGDFDEWRIQLVRRRAASGAADGQIDGQANDPGRDLSPVEAGLPDIVA